MIPSEESRKTKRGVRKYFQLHGEQVTFSETFQEAEADDTEEEEDEEEEEEGDDQEGGYQEMEGVDVEPANVGGGGSVVGQGNMVAISNHE